MRIYEVGGAVRDALLNEPVRERDWVVVGARPSDLLTLGYRQVGQDFPVFLHPQTHEEHALARTERKVAPGYTGFSFDASDTVTLEEDLARRDLTVNAIARDTDGQLIDPHGGVSDLQARVLRHVSPAFREDPVRVLRTARFAAKFHRLGFTVADETVELMRLIGMDGELEALQPERVWVETHKALCTSRPDVYFETLRACGALAHVFPEVDKLFGVPQPERWHPEIDTGVHTLMSLRVAAEVSEDPLVRFAVLVHDLGKGETPRSIWPRHHGHEERSVVILEAMAERLRVPNRFVALGKVVAQHHTTMHRASELKPSTTLALLEKIGALHERERLERFLLACEADARGRTGLEDRPYPQAQLLRDALAAAKTVSAADVDTEGLTGPQIGEALRVRRIAAIRQAKRAQ
jgi:tRNA nucleotidyltransferase (CCA-adding enzyme)